MLLEVKMHKSSDCRRTHQCHRVVTAGGKLSSMQGSSV
jgi:hypothetical protein